MLAYPPPFTRAEKGTVDCRRKKGIRMFDQSVAAADYRIMLQSGRHFNLADPQASEFTVEDIAHGLAHTCRYVGQCNAFYSVAEHSVLVSRTVRHSKLAALFHDAAEAFIGDMSGPLKRMHPELRATEKVIERAIFERLGIEWPPPPEVKRADLTVLAAEQAVLMPPGTNQWLRDANVFPARVKIRRLKPSMAKALFLKRYTKLAASEVSKNGQSPFAST